MDPALNEQVLAGNRQLNRTTLQGQKRQSALRMTTGQLRAEPYRPRRRIVGTVLGAKRGRRPGRKSSAASRIFAEAIPGGYK